MRKRAKRKHTVVPNNQRVFHSVLVRLLIQGVQLVQCANLRAHVCLRICVNLLSLSGYLYTSIYGGKESPQEHIIFFCYLLNILCKLCEILLPSIVKFGETEAAHFLPFKHCYRIQNNVIQCKRHST